MKVIAGIVLFNPELLRLAENLNAIITQVDEVILIDNYSENIDEIYSLLSQYNNIKIIKNNSNKGIAYALHQMMIYAKENNVEWVLSLDQDSVCAEGLIDEYKKWVNSPCVGIITCKITDRNFDRSNENNEYVFEYVNLCITSGCFTSVTAYFNSDGYDVNFFIDSVDHDICCNMRKYGFKILKIPFEGLLHEIGRGKRVKLLNKELIIYNHSPFRQYYIARNKFLLCYKYPQEYSVYREILLEFKRELDVLLFEKNKFKKLKCRWKGLCDARKIKRSTYDKRNN